MASLGESRIGLDLRAMSTGERPLLINFSIAIATWLLLQWVIRVAHHRHHHKRIATAARLNFKGQVCEQSFQELVKATAAGVRRSQQQQQSIQDRHEGFTPIPGCFPVELREYSVTDKKTGEMIGGGIVQSELNLVFQWEEGGTGWTIRGTRHAKGLFLAIDRGYVSRDGSAYWVERGNNGFSVLSLVQFTSATTFDGEWLTSLNQQGRYVNLLESAAAATEKKLPVASKLSRQQLPSFEQMSIQDILLQILEELLIFLRIRGKKPVYLDERPVLQIV